MRARPLIFLSTYEGKMDEKNRISIPASFRTVIESKGDNCIYAYCSFINSCIEVCTSEKINKLQSFLDEMDMFSMEKDAIATAVLSDCEPLQFDSKGRVSLPERLVKFANLKKEIFFAGKGQTFEIWPKDQFSSYYSKARKLAKETSILKKKRTNDSDNKD